MALSAVLIGCGKNRPPDFVTAHALDADPHDIEAYTQRWWLLSINREASISYDRLGGLSNTWHVLDDTVVFSDTGAFTHVFRVYRRKDYRTVEGADVLNVELSYTTHGRYTTRRNRLTITQVSKSQRAIEVRLESEAPWPPQIEGTLEALKSEFVAEIENEPQLIRRVFKSGTQYTWDVEGRLLTLSSPQQRIRLWRHTLLEILERAYSINETQIRHQRNSR